MADSKNENIVDSECKRDILEAIIENTDIQLAYFDLNFNFVEVNSEYVKGCGVKKDDLIGKNHFDLFPDDENKKIFETVRESGQSIEYRDKPFEYANDPARGITYWNWTLRPVKNELNEVVALVISLEDVTSDHQSKKKIYKSSGKLLILTLGSIFIAESIIMWLILHLPGLSALTRVIFDSTLIIIIIFPLLYLFVFRPLVFSLSEKKRIQDSLAKAYEMLELGVRERTKDLAESNKLLHEEIENRRKAEQELLVIKNDLERNVAIRTEQLTDSNLKLMEEITERKKAERRLETERTRLFSVLDEIPGSVHLVAPDHTIRFANRYFRERFGDPTNQTCHKILHGSDTPCIACEAEQVFKNKIPGEFEELHSDGRLYHVYDYPFKDINGDELILQLGIDITDKKKAENDLRRSEKKFRSLINSMTDTVFTLDDKYRITGIYGTHLRELGLQISDYDGRRISEIYGEENSVIHENSIEEVASGKTVLYEWETSLPSGKVYFQNSLSPVYDDKGHISGIVGVARDITRQKNLERQIIQTEKLIAVAQMSAMISHEFRNSLTSLKMILELQVESENPNNPEMKSLQVALSSVRHMEDIVGQLVTFSRPGPVEIGPVNIIDVIDESIQLLSIQLEKHNIILIREIEEQLPILNLDVLRIKEAISNLLLNSIQELAENEGDVSRKIFIRTNKTILSEKIYDFGHSNEFTGEIENSQTSDSSDLSLSAGVECLILEVEDNGKGINSNELNHIFNPFYTKKSTGTGLGLPLVKRVVNEHGGVVNVKSLEMQGTKFTLYLPVENNEAL